MVLWPCLLFLWVNAGVHNATIPQFVVHPSKRPKKKVLQILVGEDKSLLISYFHERITTDTSNTVQMLSSTFDILPSSPYEVSLRLLPAWLVAREVKGCIHIFLVDKI